MTEPKSRRIPKPIWFIAAAVLMVVLWVFLAVWLPYHREQIAIREYEILGRVDLVCKGPEWLRELLGEENLPMFNRVEKVWIDKVAVTNEEMKYLSGLSDLTHVYLNHTTIGDDGLKYLNGSTTLVELNLSITQVTSKGLKHLSGLRSLKDLDLHHTQVSDEGLKHLRDLTNLEYLCLYETQVGDEGIKYLSGLTNLKWLWLGDTNVTEEGVKNLQKALPKCIIVYRYPTLLNSRFDYQYDNVGNRRNFIHQSPVVTPRHGGFLFASR